MNRSAFTLTTALTSAAMATLTVCPPCTAQTFVHKSFQLAGPAIQLPANPNTGVPRRPMDVELGGLRGDPANPTGIENEPDLAVANSFGASVYAYHHLTGFSYDETQFGLSQFPTGTTPFSIARGDRLVINNDRPDQEGIDLIINNATNPGFPGFAGVRALDNDGGSGFFPKPLDLNRLAGAVQATEFPLYTESVQVRSVAAGQLDTSARDEFAAISIAPSNNLHIYRNAGFTIDEPFVDGQGILRILVSETVNETVIPLSIVPEDVGIADVNGDGFNDLVVCGTTGIAVVLNLDNLGTFGSPILSTVSGGVHAAIGDVDGDTVPDVLSGGFIATGQGDGTFVSGGAYAGAGNGDVQLADLDLDGDLDLVTSGGTMNNTVSIGLNTGAGVFTPAVGSPVTVGTRPQGLRLGDINGDGLPDISVVNELSDTVSLIENVAGILEDLNGDGVVNGGDIAVVLNNWGPCPAPPATCPADLSGDSVVDGQDVAFILNAWGATAVTAAPASKPGFGDTSILSGLDDDEHANATGGNALLYQLGFSSSEEYVNWLDTLTPDEMAAHISELIHLILDMRR